MKIEHCTSADSGYIAKAVLMALHLDPEEMPEALEIFKTVAGREDSQYSYLNSLKAVTEDGGIAGIVVAYDGGRLHQLQKAFKEVYESRTGKSMSRLTDETQPGEWYLDSLAVWPEYRGVGVGAALIEAAEKLAPAGLRPGLLCAKGNAGARRLYEKLGFGVIGERPFLGEMMDHLVRIDV